MLKVLILHHNLNLTIIDTVPHRRCFAETHIFHSLDDTLARIERNHYSLIVVEVPFVAKRKPFMPAVRDSVAVAHKDTSESAVVIGYGFYFVAGGLWNLLVKWVEDGANESPEEMAAISVKIINRIE